MALSPERSTLLYMLVAFYATFFMWYVHRKRGVCIHAVVNKASRGRESARFFRMTTIFSDANNTALKTHRPVAQVCWLATTRDSA